MHKVSEVDAAEGKLRAELARQHQTVQELQSVAASAEDGLTRAMRTYQVLLSEGAAEAQAAQQAVDRLQSLMDACQMLDAPSRLPEGEHKADQVTPWVSSATVATGSPKVRTVKPPKQTRVQPAVSDPGAVLLRQQKRHLTDEEKVAGQEKAVRQLDKQLEQLKPLAQQQSVARSKEPHHKTQLSSSPVQHAARTIRIGDQVYIRETPAAPRWRLGHHQQQAEDALMSREMAIANRDENSMENSEEQKLSSVASMIVSNRND